MCDECDALALEGETLTDEQEHCADCGAVMFVNDAYDNPDYDTIAVSANWDGGCGRFVCKTCYKRRGLDPGIY